MLSCENGVFLLGLHVRIRENAPVDDSRKDVLSRAEQIAADIRKRITTGEYRPNTLLPTARELAAAFGASTRTIIEALALLAEADMVSQAPGRGTLVRDPMERLDRPRIAIVYGQGAWWGVQGNIELIRGAQDALTRLGYPFDLILVMWPGERDFFNVVGKVHRPEQICDLPERYGAFCSSRPSTVRRRCWLWRSARRRLVVANCETGIDVTCTWMDHAKTTRRAVKVLADMRHRRIAYVGREPDYVFYGEALKGYLAGLADADIVRDDALIVNCLTSSPFASYRACKAPLGIGQPAHSFRGRSRHSGRGGG